MIIFPKPLKDALEQMRSERRSHDSEYNPQSLENTAKFCAYAYRDRLNILQEGRVTIKIGLYENPIEEVGRLVITHLIDGKWSGNGRSYDLN